MERLRRWLDSPAFGALSRSQLSQLALSTTDQLLAVGGMFLVNVVLARTQTKQEYGMFVLSYTIFTFLASLHNAVIVEPYTVYGSGKYRAHLPEYSRLMAQGNVLIALLLTGFLACGCLLCYWIAPRLLSRSLIGLGLTLGVLLSGLFLRRVFYVERKPAFAATASLVFFITVSFGLWMTKNMHILGGLSAFLVVAAGWIIAGAVLAGRLPFRRTSSFLELQPRYWQEHWKYARWVMTTAFVFQLTTQGYYWLVAGFLSVKEVADLRAMYLLVGPVDQFFAALYYLVLPALASRHAMNRMDDLLSLWKRYALGTVAITASFAIVVRILAAPLMHVVYGDKFDGLGPLLSNLALLPLVMGVGNTMAHALNAVEKPKYVFYAFVCSGAATFLVGTPLVIQFRLPGAVYGMLFSGAVFTAALAVGFVPNIHAKAREQAVPSWGSV